MQDDLGELIRRNEEINVAENAGDLEALGKLVAEKLAFRRRDGSFVDRGEYLGTPKPGDRTIQIDSVHVFANRAVVACVVTDAGKVTHNLRLFVKVGGEWMLLGWANEPV